MKTAEAAAWVSLRSSHPSYDGQPGVGRVEP